MFKATLVFRRITYDYYGDTSRIITVQLEAETRKKLNKLISKECRDSIYTHYGNSNILLGRSMLVDSSIIYSA